MSSSIVLISSGLIPHGTTGNAELLNILKQARDRVASLTDVPDSTFDPRQFPPRVGRAGIVGTQAVPAKIFGSCRYIFALAIISWKTQPNVNLIS
jgi:hypothetical protein